MFKKILSIIALLVFITGCTPTTPPTDSELQNTIDSLTTLVDSLSADSTYADTIKVERTRWIDTLVTADLNRLIFSRNDTSGVDTSVHWQVKHFVDDTLRSTKGTGDFNLDKTPYYFDLKFYFSHTAIPVDTSNILPIKGIYYKATGAVPSQTVTLPMSYSTGYMKFDLGRVAHVDSIKLITNQDGRSMDYWLSSDTVSVDKEKYVKDGTVVLNNTYIPVNKDIRYINISTSNNINWEIKDIKAYGKVKN